MKVQQPSTLDETGILKVPNCVSNVQKCLLSLQIYQAHLKDIVLGWLSISIASALLHPIM